MKTIVLCDTDILLYRAAASSETKVPAGFGEGEEETVEFNFTAAKRKFNSMVKTIMNHTMADEIWFPLSDPNHNWRKDHLPSYKSNRNPKAKPIGLKQMRKWCEDTKENCISRPGLEGDDVMGILATKRTPDTQFIIASIDKDMHTVPGLHYHLNTHEIIEVNPEEAHLKHMTQTLTGDRVDGYTGLPGFGPKKVEKLFAGEPSEKLWSLVVEAYRKQELTEADALLQARMAYILQAPFYNFKTKEHLLWEPPAKPVN